MRPGSGNKLTGRGTNNKDTRMMARVTLKDIATATGLSVSSVSLALRGDKRFPKETLDRVRAAADRLGYIYNQGAADLRMSRNNTIAVCLGELSNPIFNDMLISAEREIHRRGRRLLLGITRESRERQADFLRQALQIGCEALLLCPAYGTTRSDLDEILVRNGQPLLPTVLFFRSIEGFAAPQVVSDEFHAGQLSARAAMDAGHRRMYWIGGGQETSASRLREAGAVSAFRRAGLEPVRILHGPTSRAFGFEAATRILSEDGADDIALLCFSDLIALGVISACHKMGRRPGEDVSVIGCDDMNEVQFAVPPLTTIRTDIERIIERAMQAAVDREEAGLTTFEPKLVLRESLRVASRT